MSNPSQLQISAKHAIPSVPFVIPAKAGIQSGMTNVWKNAVLWGTLFIAGFLPQFPAFAQNVNPLRAQPLGDLITAKGTNFYSDRDLPTLVGYVIQGLLGVIGVIFLSFIVTAGVKWVTAAGEENKLKEAHQLLLQSVLGLAVVLAAYAISVFVVNTLSKATGVR